MHTETPIRDVIIVGSGPAGYTAAIYAARANLKPLVLAGMLEAGGELMKTTEVENFPGFPMGIMGPELMEKMQEQAERFGAEILYEDAESLELDGEIKKVVTEDETFLARTVIVATGSAYRKLGVPGEEEFSSRGVSYCATCDAAFFQDQQVAVVGGGDTAVEEALFLAKYAASVVLIVRGNELRASKVMADRARASEKIAFLFGASVSAIEGTSKVENIRVSLGDGMSTDIEAGGIFVAIGNDPRTGLVSGQLELTNAGTIAVDGRSSRTSIPGVFAAGDVIDPSYRQAITAAASGCVAAQDVEHYLAGAVRELASLSS